MPEGSAPGVRPETRAGAPAASENPVPPRFAVFTHDTFGLGHVRRCLRFIRRLSQARPDAAILLVTGSPALSVLGGLPPNVDVVKIPTLARTGSAGRRPPHLPIDVREITGLRERLIHEAVLGFAPDVFLVDNFPLGSRRELRNVLEALRPTRTRTVLGLRDILDAPEIVRGDWTRLGVYDVLDTLYDRILVYGSRDVMDLAEAYALPSGTAAKVHYCGYVTDPPTPAPVVAEATRSLGVPDRFLLATGGGGGDGLPLLSAFLEALALLPPSPALVLTGPLMNPADRDRLREQARDLPGVHLRDFLPDLHTLLPAAEVVVSMCGYNTAAEIVAQGARAVVVPRTWRYGEHEKGNAAGVEWEQLLRARALARLGLVDMVEPEALGPESLARSIEIRRAAPPPAACALDLEGVETVTRELLDLASAGGRNHARP